MHAQGHTSWNRSKSVGNRPSHLITPTIAAASAMACEDCVPTTYVTSQCTDQCVVITCDDPHELNECPGTGDLHCDLVCDGSVNCIDCNGFDKIFQCCTDYHSYSAEPCNLEHISSTSFPYPSLEEIFCSCSNFQHAGPPDFPDQLQCASPLETLSLQSTLPSTPLDTPCRSPLTNSPVGLPTLPPPKNPESFTCMWAHCEAKFSSLAELVGHVNLDHLRSPVHQQEVNNVNVNPAPDITNMTCQWSDCTAYPPQAIPTSSTGDQASEVLNFLTAHLLNDHLGIIDHNPPPVATIASTSGASLEKSGKVDIPVTPNANTFNCLWRSCGRSFDSNGSLTQHLNLDHIGSGKAYYECLWDGCKRSGTHGFSSKQKICRHLQVSI
ncbi:hypothetical protein H2248_010780 [Termitomyces sp. 'cryptogamus']|nr:hypothetical protein H2248_010780 [Termitomyces sp. 'cryptogamus']